MAAIHAQDGLAYLPHPWDTLRRASIRPQARAAVAASVDIIEVRNARVLRPIFNRRALALARQLGKPQGAGSDAHYAGEVGRAWVTVPAVPTRETLVDLLRQGRVEGGGPWVTARAWGYQDAHRIPQVPRFPAGGRWVEG